MSFKISQNLFRNDTTTITVVKCEYSELTMDHLRPLLNAVNTTAALGVAATYGKKCRIASISFSTLSHVLVVTIPEHLLQSKGEGEGQTVARQLIQDHLLLDSGFQKYAFAMDRLAIALYFDLSVCVRGAVDMLSVAHNNRRHSLQALMEAMGGEAILQRQNVQSLFFPTPGTSTNDAVIKVALEAWTACRAATLPRMSSSFASVPRIDTQSFPEAHLNVIATTSRQAERLQALKPTFVKNQIRGFTVEKDSIDLVSDRFSTRIRKSSNQLVKIKFEDNGVTSQVAGRTCKVDGRNARININGPVQSGKIVSVTTHGKEESTSAESTRQLIILKTLQKKSKVLSNPFFRAIWLPEEQLEWPNSQLHNSAIPVKSSLRLDSSQRAAVQKILSDEDDDRMVLIRGPPGTGKTTVIAASVVSHDDTHSGQGIWVVAQSNLAVKNIAEKLIVADFCEFKLIVSKDFHFDWHEHLYKKLELCLIRADTLFDKPIAGNLFFGCKVILCTFSMLSNPMIHVILKTVPGEVMIVDEAGQIACGDYLTIFDKFHSTLSKFVVIGDDKQLPPYGQQHIPDLLSIFEFSHLRERALFLNTQYRMPQIIGTFISENVYGNQLHTHHSLTTPNSCRFVDVKNGRESPSGHGWVNTEEALVVAKLAELYQSKSMSFRIITPYDAQRSCIERALQSKNLKSENKVFNVDSFQGNEDDHIIISVVRSEKSGFLENECRTNVMLTRCKRSMTIFSSRAFLFGSGSDTLVGKLASHLNKSWISESDVLKILPQ